MTTLLLATVAAGAFVVLTPGPGVLTVMHIGTSAGRKPAALFLLGHLAGDIMWSLLALLSLRSAQVISPAILTVLTVLSAAYLTYLGAQALRAAASATEDHNAPYERHPVAHGALFGITNPKSYPVTLAVFSAILSDEVHTFSPGTIPLFVSAICAGSLIGTIALVWFVGLPAIRHLYRRWSAWINRGVAVVFFAFAGLAVAQLA